MRFASVLILCASLLLPTLPAAATDLAEIHYVAARFPPYTLEQQDRAAGPTAALISALASRLGRPAALTVLPLARALAEAENESNTLVALIARTAARENSFHWVCPVLNYDVAMFRRRDRPDVVAESVSELARWQIAGVHLDVKTEYLLRQGVPVQETADEDIAARQLLYGRIDTMPAHPASLHLRLRELGERPDTVTASLPLHDLTSRLYLAFGKATELSVVAAVSQACEAMLSNGDVDRLMRPQETN
ncbi:MAG: substrate-binding periplasmic protein [Ferrovibrio sp.]|uniref:substrate-binding periplasmic protein n=1 Tax=Ferrovibrio sp. TaxID=1917215 RepID=UPI00391BD9A5